MKRVLVTGGSGFVGRHVISPLEERGFEVIAPRSSDVDLLAPGAPARLIDEVRPTHLLHLAWVVAHGSYWDSPANRDWLTASRQLVEAFEGERAVTVGTGAEYDWSTGGRLREDTTPERPATLYGASKLELGRLADAHARLFWIYGPCEHPERLVPSIARNLLSGEPAMTAGDRETRDYMHIADAGDALAAVLDSDLTGPVNVGSGRGTPIGDVAAEIARITGRADLLRIGALGPAPQPAELIADTAKLEAGTGWHPGVDLAQGLATTVDWWRGVAADGGAAI